MVPVPPGLASQEVWSRVLVLLCYRKVCARGWKEEENLFVVESPFFFLRRLLCGDEKSKKKKKKPDNIPDARGVFTWRLASINSKTFPVARSDMMTVLMSSKEGGVCWWGSNFMKSQHRKWQVQ